MKPGKGKTFLDKLQKPAEVEVKEGPEAWNNKYGGTKMVISTPAEIAKHLANIPKGKIITVSTLRQWLAQSAGGDYTCPLTTGIFLNIVAGASEELLANGSQPINWWRVVPDNYVLNPKLPNNGHLQAQLLNQEGVWVEEIKAKLRVVEPKSHLL